MAQNMQAFSEMVLKQKNSLENSKSKAKKFALRSPVFVPRRLPERKRRRRMGISDSVCVLADCDLVLNHRISLVLARLVFRPLRYAARWRLPLRSAPFMGACGLFRLVSMDKPCPLRYAAR